MKKQPSNLGASVRQRLLNLAKVRDEDFDLVLTRFALERLLYRISVSEHAGKFILKGAMLVAVWLPDAFRATRDLDLLGAGDASPAGAEAVFKDICRTHVEPDGVEFDASSVQAELIRENQQYLGTRVKLEARIAGAVIHHQETSGTATPSCHRQPRSTSRASWSSPSPMCGRTPGTRSSPRNSRPRWNSDWRIAASGLDPVRWTV